MKTNLQTITAAALLACSLLVTGCDFDYPAGTATHQPLDTSLLGTWESTHETSADGKPTRLTVTRVSDTVFHMEMQEAGFTAHSVDLPDRNVLQLKLVTLAGKSYEASSYAVCSFSVSGNELRILRMGKAHNQTLGSAVETRRHVLSILRGDSYHGSNYTFRRAGYRAPSATPTRSVSGQRLAVEDITCRFRGSFLDDGSKVLILRNVRPYSVDFHLKCYTRRGQSKTLFVSLAANSSTEVGFLEGWDGNFVTGERCEAYLDGNLVWTLDVP